jgi:hypothetical protein
MDQGYNRQRCRLVRGSLLVQAQRVCMASGLNRLQPSEPLAGWVYYEVGLKRHIADTLRLRFNPCMLFILRSIVLARGITMALHACSLGTLIPRGHGVRLTNYLASALTAVVIVVGVFAYSNAEAATTANANSPLGMNLVPVNYYTPEQPFLNILKTESLTQATQSGGGWTTHSESAWDTGEEAYVQLDANGYPTTLTASSSDPKSPQLFNSVGVVLFSNLVNSNAGKGLPYRSGQYIVLYDGQGTLSFGFDASLVSSSTGQYIINVVTPNSGIDFRITSTDPNHTGNYIRNIRVVKAEEASLLAAGNVYTPAFLAQMQNFHVLRFAGWAETGQANVIGSWANRTQPTDAGWGSANGVPLEAEVQLANAVGIDPWLNVPINADDNYITLMATLIHSSLNKSQRVYLELSNEVWNSGFPQYAYAAAQGQAMWPSSGASTNDLNRSWYGMRTAQMCDIWKSVWGSDGSRVTCILGAQAANPYSATQSLNCPLWSGTGNAPCAGHNISAVAIAPYFALPSQAPLSWTSNSDGGLANLFQEFNQGGLISGDYPGGALKQQSDWEVAMIAAIAPYKLPLVAYEGGQSLVAFPTYQNGSPVTNLYVAANRDPRMGAAYTTLLNNWKSNGGGMFIIYDDISQANMYGEWGALESFMDIISPLSSAPVKWQAIQNFITGDPCWWAACAGTIGATGVAVPMAPTNLTVQ